MLTHSNSPPTSCCCSKTLFVLFECSVNGLDQPSMGGYGSVQGCREGVKEEGEEGCLFWNRLGETNG